MERIPQSIAKRVPLLAFDSSDHTSPASGKTIAVVISKNGAAFGNPSAGPTNATEIGSGWYYVDLSTTDTGTSGPLLVVGTAAGIDPINAPPICVVNAHNAGFDALPAAAAEAAGGLYTRGTGAGQINQPSNGEIDVAVVDKTGFELTSAYDPAKTAAQPGDVMKVSSGTGANEILTSSGKVSIVPADIATIAADVWDEPIAGHLTAGSTGAELSAAGGDPWSTAVPGSYGSGTAGKILGDNLNATVSSRATPADIPSVPTANQNADALLDRASGVETSWTLRQAMRVMLAVLAGKLSGAATTTITIRDVGDTKNRVTATVDTNDNRTAVTYDKT